MVISWTLVVGIIAATAATIGTTYAVTKDLFSLREKKRKELPRISLYDAPHISLRRGHYFCFLETGPDRMGWKIIRADVKQVEHGLSAPLLDKHQGREALKCIRNLLPPYKKGEWTEYGSYGEWSDYCEWPEENNLFDIVIHEHCDKVHLSFTCEMASRAWWNLWRRKVKLPFLFQKGTRYPMLHDHPTFKDL